VDITLHPDTAMITATIPNIAAAAANEAEEQAEVYLNGALDRLNQLNASLLLLRGDIKASQAVASGSICLELYACGKTCVGCPHPRWVRYVWTRQSAPGEKRHLMCINLSKLGKDPAKSLLRNAVGYSKTLDLIADAKAVLIERSALVKLFRSLGYYSARAARQPIS